MSARAGGRPARRENPWPGLDAFEENATGYFHGRDDRGEALLRSVLDSPITVLYGRSGLGKTSLLRAALFPALRQSNFLPVSVRLDLTPDAPPLVEQLRGTACGTRCRPRSRTPGPPTTTRRSGSTCTARTSSCGAPATSSSPRCIVIDQFEEVFTLGRKVPEKVKRFRDDLGDLVENRIPAELAARLAATPTRPTGSPCGRGTTSC